MKIFITILLLLTISFGSEFKLRKYSNVKEFYKSIAKDVIALSIRHNTPPAAILAIAGLESGYGSGYVAQITGNILSPLVQIKMKKNYLHLICHIAKMIREKLHSLIQTSKKSVKN